MLFRLMGDEELARTVSDGFLQDIPRQIELLRGYLQAGDITAAGRQAHTIKGASASVGGERLSRAAGAVERAEKDGDRETAQAAMADLEVQCQRLSQAMRRETATI